MTKHLAVTPKLMFLLFITYIKKDTSGLSHANTYHFNIKFTNILLQNRKFKEFQNSNNDICFVPLILPLVLISTTSSSL